MWEESETGEATRVRIKEIGWACSAVRSRADRDEAAGIAWSPCS